MKRFVVAAACAVFGVLVASATDFTLKTGVSGIFDWTDGGNYVGDVAPAANDSVIVPEDVTVVISNVMPNASLTRIGGLSRIRPSGNRTRIVFAVEESETLTLNCAVNWNGESSSCIGTMVKDGKGELSLTAPVDRYKYGAHKTGFYVNLEINAGTLRMTNASGTGDDIFFNDVSVAEGATWVAPSPGPIKMRALRGGGTVASGAAIYQYIYATGGTSAEPIEFSGAFTGWETLSFQARSYYNLTGTNNTGTGTFDIEGNYCVDGGRIGVRKFGKKGQPSSIGAQSTVALASRNGFWLTSIRRPDDPLDECDKNFTIFSGNGLGTAVLDGGALGGVTFTGSITEHSTNPGQKRILLTGSNTTECVFATTFSRSLNGAYPTGGYTYHLTKRGTGTWRMGNKSSLFSGAIAVEEGTLAYDSVAACGQASALGTALDLYGPVDAHGVALTADDQVGYAILLGDGTAAHEGNLAYSGSSASACTNRPIAVSGRGRLTNGTAQDMTVSGVHTIGSDKNVLTLDGDDLTAVNVLTGVNDTNETDAAVLSIVKDGAGTWTLNGDLSLRGTIAVKAGTLLIQNNYTWYKWLIKSCKQELSEKAAIVINLGEFGLYSADGARQNKGMAYTRSDNGKNAEYPNLLPGHLDYGFTTDDKFEPQNVASSYPRNLSLLVDDVISSGQIGFWYQTAPDNAYYKIIMEDPKAYRNVPHHDPTQTTTHLPIVMRLSDDAMPVAYYDYATRTAGDSDVYRTRLYASVDGVNWDELETEDQCREPQSQKWSFAGRTMIDGTDDVHTNALGVVDGRAIQTVPQAYRAGYLSDVDSYAVSAGATLKMRTNAQIRGLTLDCSGTGAGTIDGATFAANGSINVTGLGKRTSTSSVQYTLVNVTGFDNVANWTLKENGVPTSRLSATVKDGKITITRAGMMIIVR